MLYKDKYKLYILAWDKICRLKREGGLCTRGMQDMSAVFLTKQGCKKRAQPTNIWVGTKY